MKKSLFIIMLTGVFFTQLFCNLPIEVPNDYPTIQEAINHAYTLGGYVTIEVSEGIYYETLDINFTSGLLNLTLIGVDGAENCIIDGGNGQSIIDVENYYQLEKFFKISGFTIRNSVTASGIYVHTNNYLSLYLNTEISENILQNCRTGINLYRINNCVIKSNAIINYSQIYPSYGIQSDYVNNVIIDGNFISNFKYNITFLSSDGKVINNEIEVVYESESEGVHLQFNSNADIINNLFLIYYCVTGTPIRGIYNGPSSNAKIINNTFIGFGDDTVGYNVFGTGTTEKFVNNIMWNLNRNIYAGSSAFEVDYCCYNGTIPLECEPEPLDNHNVVDIYPEFNNASVGDYTLSFENESPCIDTGDKDTDGDGDDWEIDENDRDIDGSRKDMGCYPYLHNDDLKHFTPGWQWISFPVLTEQGVFNDHVFEHAYWNLSEQIPGLFQLTSGGDPTIDDFLRIDGKREFLMDIQYINDEFQDNLFGNMLFRHEGYKVEVHKEAEPCTLTVDGNRLSEDYTINGTMVPDEYHWLGYWIPRTQNMIESFGPFWQNVEKVKSEDWFYSPSNDQRGGDPTIPVLLSPENLTFEYGKTYLVQFNEDVEDFYWTDSNIITETEKKAEPENFTYTEKADYEAIDVFNIPLGVIEIGVFEDEVCVGAVVVEDTCAQILAYSDYSNRDPVPFTFEVVTGRGFSTPIKDYQLLDWETGEFESRSIISGRQEYSVIRFGDDDEPEDNTLSTPQLYGNYPNPFNPTTTIEFSLVQTSQSVTLEVFNIKGQKVKTLYKGIAEEGKHSVTWEGKDTNGKSVSTGIYFYKLKTGKKEISRKMLLLK